MIHENAQTNILTRNCNQCERIFNIEVGLGFKACPDKNDDE